MSIGRSLTSIGAVCLLSSSLADAQQSGEEDETVRLETVQVTGLRSQNAEDATASFTIIDQDALAIRNSPFIADQLRQVPGLAVSRSGSLGGLTQIRLRGAEANHTLVLVDGIEVSDPVNGETDFGLWSSLPSSRIEVARGEQSAIYGSDAIGGVVYIDTRRGTGLIATAEGGSLGTARGFVDAALQSGDWSGGLTFAGFTTDGVDTSGLAGEVDGSSSYSAAGRVGFEEGLVKFNLIGRYGVSHNDFDSDTDFDGLLNDTLDETEAEQILFGGVIGVANDVLDTELSISWTRVDRENTNLDTLTSQTIGERFKVGWTPSYSFRLFGADQSLTGLVAYQEEKFEQVFPDTTFGDANQSQSIDEFSLAAEYRFEAGPVDFSASIRNDDNDRFADATTWRVGGGIDFEHIGGRIRASVGEGNKTPTFTELFGFIPASFVGNPDLVSEESLGWEIGWAQRLGERASIDIVYFAAELENEIFTSFSFDPVTFASSATALNRPENSDRKGVEISGDWSPVDGWQLTGSFSYIDSTDDNGVREIRVPEFTGSISSQYSFDAVPLTLGVAFDFVGEQTDLNFGSFPAETVSLDGYVLASATATYQLTDRVALTVRGENLFDQTVRDVFSFNSPGIGGFAGLKLVY